MEILIEQLILGLGIIINFAIFGIVIIFLGVVCRCIREFHKPKKEVK